MGALIGVVLLLPAGMALLLPVAPSSGSGGGTLSLSVGTSGSTGPAPLTVELSGSILGGVAPFSYHWSFGDGNSSTTARPDHTYVSPGNYTVSLRLTDVLGVSVHASLVEHAVPPVPGVPGPLVSGARLATTPSSFWSVDVQTDCSRCIATDAGTGAFLNATPFQWVRYGADTERCNVSAGVSYSDSGVASRGCAYNISALKAWCNGRTPTCRAILDLPGENNNSAEDAAIARYIVHTVGFQPTYWSIGNEPTGWTHFGKPWTRWSTADRLTPTPLAYAVDVRNAIRAVAAVDPGARFIGIEAACSCNTAWFTDVAKVDGSLVSAIAYHSYPSNGQTTVGLSQFYAPLASTSNLSGSLPTVRSAWLAGCSTCRATPILVNEYNAGPGWTPSNLGGSYANAVFLAASVAQALRANVTQLTVFNLQTYSTTGYGFSMLNAAGNVGPTGLLFSKVLDRLVLGTVDGTGVSTTLGNVWAVETHNGTTGSLLVVNANLSHRLALSLGRVFPVGVPATVVSWGPGLATPSVSTGTTSLQYSVPSQGILLLHVSGLAPALGASTPAPSHASLGPGTSPGLPSSPMATGRVGRRP